MKRQIAVIGTDGEIPERVRRIAENVGREIAKSDCILVCGGRGGVMEAACKGAKEAGGLTVGILPALEKSGANKFLDVVMTTSFGYARNALVVSAADAVIAIHGSIGTLSEIALALNYGKPVIAVEDSGGISAEVRKLEDEKIRENVVSSKAPEAVPTALELIT